MNLMSCMVLRRWGSSDRPEFWNDHHSHLVEIGAAVNRVAGEWAQADGGALPKMMKLAILPRWLMRRIRIGLFANTVRSGRRGCRNGSSWLGTRR